MNYVLWLTPLIGALIGWLTNYLAIKMIFRPQKPIRIYPFTFELQGLVPKRKSEIAQTLGTIIERELVSWEELLEEVINGDAGEHLIQLLAVQAKETVAKSLPSITPLSLKSVIENLVENTISKKAPHLLEQFVEQSIDDFNEHINLAKMIENKINQMDWKELEDLVFEVAFKELKHIEVLGGVIGFFIGLSQLLLGYFF